MGGGGIECHGKGSQRVKKICLYLDIVTIALTPPPCFLGHRRGTFFFTKKSADKQLPQKYLDLV